MAPITAVFAFRAPIARRRFETVRKIEEKSDLDCGSSPRPKLVPEVCWHRVFLFPGNAGTAFPNRYRAAEILVSL